MDKDAKHTVESHDNLRLKLVSQWYASIDFPKRQAYFLLHDWTLGEAPENKSWLKANLQKIGELNWNTD